MPQARHQQNRLHGREGMAKVTKRNGSIRPVKQHEGSCKECKGYDPCENGHDNGNDDGDDDHDNVNVNEDGTEDKDDDDADDEEYEQEEYEGESQYEREEYDGESLYPIQNMRKNRKRKLPIRQNIKAQHRNEPLRQTRSKNNRGNQQLCGNNNECGNDDDTIEESSDDTIDEEISVSPKKAFGDSNKKDHANIQEHHLPHAKSKKCTDNKHVEQQEYQSCLVKSSHVPPSSKNQAKKPEMYKSIRCKAVRYNPVTGHNPVKYKRQR